MDKYKPLQEHLESTSSGAEKLLAIWEDLSMDAQLQSLNQIRHSSMNGHFRSYDALTRKIQLKALSSNYVLVRYQVAAQLYYHHPESDDELAVNDLIDKDPSDLVRYAPLEGLGSRGLNPSTFFSIPRLERCARFRYHPTSSTYSDGYDTVEFITTLIENGLINNPEREDEVNYMMSEYVLSFHSTFKSDFNQEPAYDGWSECEKGKTLEQLWNVVPKLPEYSAYLLITTLPERVGFLKSPSCDALKGIAEKLSDDQIQILLERDDIHLEDVRKEVFWGTKIDNEYHSRLWEAACCNHFSINNEDFERLLELPIDEKIERLQVIFRFARDVSLEYLFAIYYIHAELIKQYEDKERPEWAISYLDYHYIEKRLKVVYKQGDYGDSELWRLRLAALAEDSLSWTTHTDVSRYFGGPIGAEINSLFPIRATTFWDSYLEISKHWKKNKLPISLLPEAYIESGHEREKTDEEAYWDAERLNDEERLNDKALKTYRKIIFYMLGYTATALTIIGFSL